MSRSNKQAPLPMQIYVTEAQMFTDKVMFYSCIYVKFRLVNNFLPNSDSFPDIITTSDQMKCTVTLCKVYTHNAKRYITEMALSRAHSKAPFQPLHQGLTFSWFTYHHVRSNSMMMFLLWSNSNKPTVTTIGND